MGSSAITVSVFLTFSYPREGTGEMLGWLNLHWGRPYHTQPMCLSLCRTWWPGWGPGWGMAAPGSEGGPWVWALVCGIAVLCVLPLACLCSAVLPTFIARTHCFSIEGLLGLLWSCLLLTISSRNSSKLWAHGMASFLVSSTDASFSLIFFSLF